MKLYLENSNKQRVLVAEPELEENVSEIINQYCKDKGFEIYYIRGWKNEEGLTVLDFGSYDEFFLLDEN